MLASAAYLYFRVSGFEYLQSSTYVFLQIGVVSWSASLTPFPIRSTHPAFTAAPADGGETRLPLGNAIAIGHRVRRGRNRQWP